LTTQLSGVPRPITTTDGAASAWVVAFALGLAHSARSDAERIGELQEATGRRLDLLHLAHDRLRVAEVADPGTRLAVLDLIARAIATC